MFFPDMDNKGDANAALAQRRKKKKKKAKQNKVSADCQMDYFPASCPPIERRTEKEA